MLQAPLHSVSSLLSGRKKSKVPVMRPYKSSVFLPLCCLCASLTTQLQAQEHHQPDANPAVHPDEPAAGPDFNSAFGNGFGALPQIPESIRVTNDGQLEFDSEKGTYLFAGKVLVKADNGVTMKAQRVLVNAKSETATLTGNVSVLQNSKRRADGTLAPGVHLFADHVLLDAKKQTVTLTGNVSVYQGPTLHRGDGAVYNYGTRAMETKGLASRLGPILLESDRFRLVESNGRKAYVGDNAGITTHDVSEPNFWLRSDRTTIFPGEKVVFKNLRLYAGDTPVFWLPYLSQPLDADLGYHFLPGARTNWGLFLLNTYGVLLGGQLDEETGEREGAWLLSRWHLDILSRRGVGTGVDLFDTRLDNENLGWLKLYYLNDADASLERSSEERGFVNEDRWKLELKHRIDLQKSDTSRTYAEFDITALSDRFFLEDFEPSRFRVDPNPDNEVGVFHRNSKILTGLYGRLRLNDFFQSDTRLPELFVDQVKGPLFGTPILHEGQTSLGIYREQLADFFENNLEAEAANLQANDPRLNEIDSLLADRGFTRFHTYHEFSLPLNPGGKVAVVPRAGFGHTSYSDIDGDTSSFSRTHLSAGLDISAKFSKLYPDVVNDTWGLDSLLHIFQPYANFTFLSTDDLDSSFNGIETLTPSTRPRPLEVGRFTAVDDLNDWSILRLGVRNRLLTKRNGDTHDWLTLDTYIDVFFDDPEFNRNVSNLYNDLAWQPLPWMRLNLETQFPIIDSGSGFTEISGSVSFLPSDSLELTLGYRQLNSHPILQDSDRVDIRAYKRLNEAWGIGFFQRWELDDSTLEVQQLTLNHDFDSWTAALGLLMRDNRDGQREYSLLLNFTLKEFPRVRLPLSVDNE